MNLPTKKKGQKKEECQKKGSCLHFQIRNGCYRGVSQQEIASQTCDLRNLCYIVSVEAEKIHTSALLLGEYSEFDESRRLIEMEWGLRPDKTNGHSNTAQFLARRTMFNSSSYNLVQLGSPPQDSR